MAAILLVDDHPVVREGYRRLLERQPGYRVVAEAADAAEAYRLYKAHEPDIVVMDLALPGASGIEATSHIRQWDGRARILIFTMRVSASLAVKAFEAGAAGYVSKASPPGDLVEAVAAVRAGERAMSPDIARAIAEERVSNAIDILDPLSPREVEILRLTVSGEPASDIATLLGISLKTVQNNQSLIKAKLGARTDAHLVWIAMGVGLVSAGRDTGPR